MPVLIELVNGGFALVDEADLPLLSRFPWRSQHGYKNGVKGPPSAVVTGSVAHGTYQSMHRLLMSPSEGQVVDHINGLPLNNTRANLRICSRAENSRNRKRSASNKAGVKGVYRACEMPRHGRCWRAEIKVAGVKHHLGSFRTKTEAGKAYAEAAKKLHGEYARVA